jgi:hypothetical protein
MRTVELDTADLSTKEGRIKYLNYKNSKQWILITDCMGTEAVFEHNEKEEEYYKQLLTKKS